MELFRRAALSPKRLGILPGTFNPVTVAHVALAQAALRHVDEVVFVLPRAFPHKHYLGATFSERLEMLRAALAGHPCFSIAASARGLFVEIAEECREIYGSGARLTFLCGRDAAERIAGWDYGRQGAFPEMLRKFDLLVAARSGEYSPPPELVDTIQPLVLRGAFDHISATEVRRRVSGGENWEHLVPEPVRDQVRRIYAATAPGDLNSPAGT